MQILKEIGKYIKSSRLKLKKTQKELAEESGVSLMTLRRAEGGEVITVETLVSIMEAFGELENLRTVFRVMEGTPRDIVKGETPEKRVRKKAQKENKSWSWGDEANE